MRCSRFRILERAASKQTGRRSEIHRPGLFSVNLDHLRALMESVRDGELSPEAACDRLKNLPFEDLGFAKVDHHRSLRTGMPEVIYCTGKTADQVAGIFVSL